MKHFSKAMLLATIASSVMATTAQAQSSTPVPGPNDGDNSLHGAGATSIQSPLVQELNCIGGNNSLGSSSGTLTPVTEPTVTTFNSGTSGATTSFNCSTQSIQANFSGKYVGTGSGFGRQAWRNASNQFDPTTAGVFNPFVTVSGQSPWTNVQYAFADSSITQSDLGTTTGNYNNATTGAVTIAGPAIQFPKYVLPVAIAYTPVYGKNSGGANMTFNVRTPQNINGVAAGGLRLSRELYCKVFNGYVKNFNDALFTTANSSTTLQDTVNDTATRWSTFGVPIRLVGRLDKSGTTDIFTRALAAQCGSTDPATAGFNKYRQNAETLPYDYALSGNVTFVSVRADTGLQSGGPINAGNDPLTTTGHPYANVNLIGKEYFNGTAIVTPASNTGGTTSGPTGAVGSGLYLVANGSGQVRNAINLAPDYALGTGANAATLNGKIGYIGSDFIAGSISAGTPALFAAALQQAAGTTYLMPTAVNGTNAIGTTNPILPPQASATTGAFNTTETRLVRDPAGGTTPIAATRANPLAWYDVLYAGTNSLANPADGYPITGTTQFLGYQCYKASNRPNIVEFLALNVGKLTTDSSGTALPTGLFTGTVSTNPGLLALSNIGIMPTEWKNAIAETFLRNSTQSSGGVTLGSLNLWIQNDYTRASTKTANTTVCGTKTGA